MKKIMTNNLLNVGLIGLGSMGKNHARVLSNLKGVRLKKIYDISIQNSIKNDSFAEILTEDFDDFLNSGLDYCVIASPTKTHKKIANEVISKGISVLIEKPITHDFKSGLELLNNSKNNKVICGVGHIERYNPAVREAKKLISRNKLGQILQISTRRLGPFHNRITDTGVIKDLATHDIDLVHFLSESKYSDLMAFGKTINGDLEDLISINGILENSVIVNHLVNWLCPFKERNILILGELGAFQIDLLNSDLIFYENGKHKVQQREIYHFTGSMQGNVQLIGIDKPEPLKIQHEKFRDALLGKSWDIVTLEEALLNLQVAEQIEKKYKKQLHNKL